MHRRAWTPASLVLLACYGALLARCIAGLAGQAAPPGEPAPLEGPALIVEPEASEAPVAAQEAANPRPPAPVVPSPELTALRASIQRALALVARQPLNTRDNTPGDLIQLCLAFGCDAAVAHGSPAKRINAIGCLCWNYPCAGYRLLQADGDRVIARVGHGLQASPAEFLAALAQSGVPADYEIRVSDSRRYTVADLVESEKLNCRSGGDLSLALVGLAHYVPGDHAWHNDLGEPWSVGRLVAEETARLAEKSGPAATNRLIGLSYAVQRRQQQGLPIDGAFLAAQEHLAEFQQFALDIQNPDGTWHPAFFARKGASNDAAGVLRSTGHIFEWLAFSLPDDRLGEPRIVRSAGFLARLLGNPRSDWNVTATSAENLRGLMHAAHALAIYEGRLAPPPSAEPLAGSDIQASEQAASLRTPE